jgi:ribokinase
MKQPGVLVIGGANIDLVATVERSPRPGETIFGSSFKIVPGGKGANQAVAAARLGAKTYFGGCVGSDAFGTQLRETLNAAGIDTTYLKSHPTTPTGTAIILVAGSGQNSIVVIPSANMEFGPEDVCALEPVFAQVQVMLIQLEVPLATVEAALALARRHGVLSILDAGPAQDLPAAILELADIVSPNETEAEALTGVAVLDTEKAREAGQRLMARNCRDCVIKLGGNGAYHCADGESLHVPAYPVSPVDTTAAGDAFTAALGCAWRSLPRVEAIKFANAAGALATLTAGAQPSMPEFEAVKAFLREKGDYFLEQRP